ncbi:hypothetical protein [Haloarcula salinisoli]|uniref:Uncharacterized protein n=1 Tax=Haloarcula salinisoli TaxID=2487746 RepID=A0A8J8CE52_9EURY|nr:hypothetical protein [Halomicroarcula salinisoli]MBX0288155.1 hypothetical protein [Halomicroarcula salinisoli]MBX0305305.1 hypothetical protein [Halomicroarcula salinisoli]
MSATTAQTAEVLCKRFGPGRLPGADNRDIGAGYAFATAALSAATVFVVAAGFEPITKYGLGAFGPAHGGIYMFGVYAIPFVVPSAFLAGAFTWAQRPASARYWGVAGGIAATVLTYGIGAPLSVSGWYVITLLHPEWTMSGNLPRLTMLFGMFGFLTTFWITLPVGALSGHIHERAVEGN